MATYRQSKSDYVLDEQGKSDYVLDEMLRIGDDQGDMGPGSGGGSNRGGSVNDQVEDKTGKKGLTKEQEELLRQGLNGTPTAETVTSTTGLPPAVDTPLDTTPSGAADPTSDTSKESPLELAISQMLGVAEGNAPTAAETIGNMQLQNSLRGTEAVGQSRRGLSAAGRVAIANNANERMAREGGDYIKMLGQQEREQILGQTSGAINLLMSAQQSGETLADAWDTLDYEQQQSMINAYMQNAALSNDFTRVSDLIDAGIISYENAYSNFNTQLRRMQEQAEAGLFGNILGGVLGTVGTVFGAYGGPAGAALGGALGNALGQGLGHGLAN